MFKNLKKYRTALESKDEKFWLKQGEKMALSIFHEAARRVPAYKDFLKVNKVNPAKIRTISGFSLLPVIDKNNYLKKYPFESLCWDGDPAGMDMISLSSGSSGEPFFWLRGKEQERETALIHELFLVDSFKIDKIPTLFIVSFAMGMWVAGTLTQRAVQAIAENYDLTVISPGINNSDTLNIVKKLGEKYSQIIIAGYPPFVKDIIDAGESIGLDWKKYRIKFLFAAESFSEGWRDHLYKKVGSQDPLKDSLNIYGTADALILGHETPLSILARREANSRQEIYRSLFYSEERTPTLVQYNPRFRYFEKIGKSLIFTAPSGIPLVRYNIGDTGNIMPFSDMVKVFSDHGIDLLKEARKNQASIWRLPFLYVFGKDDQTATLYGINIYPEVIRESLSLGGIGDYVSGKFTMVTKNDSDFNQYLEVNVELKSGKDNYPADLKNKIREMAVGMLKLKSNEYNELYRSLGKKAEPEIRLFSYGDKSFFSPGAKQKWHKT